MKLLLRVLHGLLILSLLMLVLKPVLLPSASELNTAHYTLQYDCQNRLATTVSCASTAYCMPGEDRMNPLLAYFGQLISLVYFTLPALATCAPIKRLLRPPIQAF
ncbi:hypothetical protein [Legionella erythra]|uniref:Transmembrane protein n=1 Tax=Legionella erythra TaxID=448 RepID=A0A0W0TVP4_LEGER|nr:hypothetical protein [Legionella erythra]KTC99450.1 hypothetical protein Lery_0351 [Legionella erythra]